GRPCAKARIGIGPTASTGSGRSKPGAPPRSSGDRHCSRIRHGPVPRDGSRTSVSTCTSPSSSAVPVQPAALEVLSAAAPVLSRWGRWYVFGAQAVMAYGVPRLSADVDVTLALVPDAPE